MGRTACAFFWTDILPFISKIYHLPVTSWQSEPDPVLSHTRPSRRTTLMEIKGHLQTDGIRILMWLFQFLSLIHTVVMKFVFEFLCLTCPLISSPSHSSPGQTLSHMPHAVFALSTGHLWRHLLVCQGFIAGSKALPNAACLAEKLLSSLWLQLFWFLSCPFALLDFPKAYGK